MSAHWLRYFAVPMACFWLANCAGNGPTVVLNTTAGTTPIYTPPSAMPGAPTAPPPPVPLGDRSGTYAGTAAPLDTGGGLCLNTRQINGFRVHGTAVRYGGFRGTLDANGGVQMVYGRNWIFGQFEGPDFYGQLDLYGTFDQSCTYRLTLRRVGR